MQARDGKALSQEQFAEEIDVSVETVRKIEQGKGTLSLDVAKSIREKYGVSMDYLYGFSDCTNDSATTMMSYLDKLFDYHSDIQGEYVAHHITIRKSITDYLRDYAMATDFHENKGLPESAYNTWVNSIKSKLNDEWNVDDVGVEYLLVPASDYDELKKEIANDLMNSTPRPSGGSIYGKH